MGENILRNVNPLVDVLVSFNMYLPKLDLTNNGAIRDLNLYIPIHGNYSPGKFFPVKSLWVCRGIWQEKTSLKRCPIKFWFASICSQMLTIAFNDLIVQTLFPFFYLLRVVFLIKDTEDRHVQLSVTSPIEVIQLKMEDHGITAKDLEPNIATKGHISSILPGRRELTLKINLKTILIYRPIFF